MAKFKQLDLKEDIECLASQTPIIDLGRNAARRGVATSRLRITLEEAGRIQTAEAKGGRQAGLVVVLQILRERRKSWVTF